MDFKKKQRFSIRKYSVGVASVLLGMFILGLGGSALAVETNEATNDSKLETKIDKTVEAIDQKGNITPEKTTEQDVVTKVTYKFISVTEGKNLNKEVIDLQPKNSTVEGVVMPINPSQVVIERPDGTWTFIGYEKVEEKGNIIYTGKWSFERKSTAMPRPANEGQPIPKGTTFRASGANVTEESATPSEPNNKIVIRDYGTGGKDHPKSTEYIQGESVKKVTPAMTEANGASIKDEKINIAGFYPDPDEGRYTFGILDLQDYNNNVDLKEENIAVGRYSIIDDQNNVGKWIIDNEKTTEARRIFREEFLPKTNNRQHYYITYSKDYTDDLKVYVRLVKSGTNETVNEIVLTEPNKFFDLTGTAYVDNQDSDAMKALETRFGNQWQFLYRKLDGTDKYEVRVARKFRRAAESGGENVVIKYDGVTASNIGLYTSFPKLYIPRVVEQPTYYRVVNTENSSYDALRTDVSSQTYKADGTEKDLAVLIQNALEGQHFQGSGQREFEGYKLYQTAGVLSGKLVESHKVGQKWVQFYKKGNVKVIREAVDDEGTVKIYLYIADENNPQLMTSDPFNDAGWILGATTDPIKAGGRNTKVIKGFTHTFTNNPTRFNQGRAEERQYGNPGGYNVPIGSVTLVGTTLDQTSDKRYNNDYFFFRYVSATNTDGTPETHGAGNPRAYYRVNGKDLGNGTVVPLTGEAEVPEVPVYYYVQQGKVLVKYVVNGTTTELSGTGGTTIDANSTVVPSGGVTDTDWTTPGEGVEYNTTDHKPTYIKATDGKTYKLVAENNGLKADSSPETGVLPAGTSTVTYVYEEVKGKVIVHYKDENDVTIKDDVEDTPLSSVGTNYSTKDRKDVTITTGNGKEYVLVPERTLGAEEGKVTEGTTEVTYVYKEVKKGNVVVHYEDTEGNVIKSPVDDETNVPVGTKYETADKRDQTIVSNGKTYRYKEVKSGSALETGAVTEGTTEVTYVYEKEVELRLETPAKGSVLVKYVDTKGNSIKEDVTDSDNQPVGTKYETFDNKLPTITKTEMIDGKSQEVIYKYKEVKDGSDAEKGEITAGTKVVTYVYEPTGSVTHIPVLEGGERVPGSTPITTVPNETPEGTPYEFTPPTAYKDPKTGTIYVPKVPTTETGETPKGHRDIPVVYVPQTTPEVMKKGSVIVHHIDESGKAIAPSKVVKNGVPVDEVYTTEKVHVNGYKLTKDPVNKNGKVVEGVTEVTYVYTPIIRPVTPDDKVPPVPGQPVPEEPGHVWPESVKDLKLTEEVKRTIHYKYVKDGKEVFVDKEQKVTFKRNAKVNVATGAIEYSNWTPDNATFEKVPSPVKKGYFITETDKKEIPALTVEVTNPDSEVTVWYDEFGKWIPNIPTDHPEVPGTPVPYPNDPTDPTKPGTPGDNETIPYVPGHTPKDPGTNKPLVPKDPNDPRKGYNPPPVPTDPHKDTNIPYEKDPEVTKKGSIVVHYVDEHGNTIKEDVVDTNNQPVGTKYETTDNKPTTITKEGKEYILVPAKTKGNERGEVAEGTTEVTYVYRHNPVVGIPVGPNGNRIPNVPSFPIEPNGEEPGKPFDKLPPQEITTPDGKTYVPDKLNTPVPGKVTEDPQEKLVPYHEQGKVIVEYVIEGTKVKLKEDVVKKGKVGESYTTERPEQITLSNGTEYVLVPKDPVAGEYPSGTPTVITYEYRLVMPAPVAKEGFVVVNHKDEKGNLIAPTEVRDPQKVGEDYTTKEVHVNGYKLTKDPENKNGKIVEGKTVVNYIYTPIIKPVTPDDKVPPVPGQPVPEEPGHVWPESVKDLKLTEEVKRTIHYKYVKDGKEVFVDKEQKVTFKRNAKVNVATGVIEYSNWTSDNAIFEKVPSPVKKGYFITEIDKKEIPALTVEATNPDSEVTVWYDEFGKWIPNIPADHPEVPGTPVPYPNDPTDPTKPGTPGDGETIPYVPGHTPKDPGTNKPLVPKDPNDPRKGYNPPPVPTDPHKDTNIPYEKDPEVKKGTVIVKHVDEKGKDLVAPKTIVENGKVGEDYTTSKITKQGYELVKMPDNANGKVTEGTTTVTYVYKEIIEPVTPDQPTPRPGEEVPGKPGQKWPESVKGLKLTEEVKRTIHYKYVKDGKEASADVVEVLKFKREAKVNLATGEITYKDWTSEDTTFDKVTSPVIKGYVTNRKEVEEVTGVKAIDTDSEVTVWYDKLATWIPNIPADHPEVPGTPVPYPNDPTDPTKPGVPGDNETIPYVPGYTPKNPNTNEPLKPKDPKDPTKGYEPPVPKDPHKDTYIPYEKDPKPQPEPKTPTPNNNENPNIGKPVEPKQGKEEKMTPKKLSNTGENSSSGMTGVGIGVLGLGLLARKKQGNK